MSEFFSNKKFNFIFIHIPKTGGTSLKKILDDKIKIEGWDSKGELITYNKDTHKKFLYEDYIKYNSFYKFTIVRHPYKWIMSYYNFHKNKDKFYKNITSKKIKNTINISFDKWLSQLKSFNQSDWFYSNNKILVDKIIKLENFDNDVKELLNTLNLESSFKNYHFKNSKKFNIDEIKELTNKQKEKIQKICYNDFKLLGYDMSL